jgi:hypothetical protein
MTLNRSRITKKLPSILVGLALLGGATASAQEAPPPDDGAGMPQPPPEESTQPPEPEARMMMPPPEEEPVPEEPPAPPPLPEKLKASKEGWFQPAILLQGWFFVDNAPSGADPTTSTTTDGFRIRRAEFHVKGQIVPNKVQYEVHADFAKVLEPKNTTIPTAPPVTVKEPQSSISALQDVYLTYLTRWAEVSMGQFKIPVSWEGYNSSGKLLFPERAAVSKQFGDKRDLGLRITKTFTKFMYSAGVFNGAGLNLPDNNKGKDVALRLEYYPVKGLTLAAVTYDSVFDRKQPGAKDRWEVDVRYEKDALLIQAEALAARDFDASKTQIDGHGFYAAAAYKLANGLQPALRVGALEPNTDVEDDEQFQVDVGANYYLQDHNAKLQAAFTRTQFAADGKVGDNLFILAAQIYY